MQRRIVIKARRFGIDGESLTTERGGEYNDEKGRRRESE